MSMLVDYIRTHWHEVPEGVTIPEGVEFAAVWNRQDVVTHVGAGEPSTRLRRDRHAGDITRFTPEPLPEPKPTPEDSPIIATGDWDGECLLTWDDGHDAWIGTCGRRGGFIAAADSAVFSWWPAIVTPTGHGVMDDRDKRDRVDASGDRWEWREKTALWVRDDITHRGTLAALDFAYGPLRFADEEGDHE